MKCAKSFQFHSHLESLWISGHQKFMFCGGAKPLSEIRIPKIEENTKTAQPHTGHRVKANFPVQKPIFSYFSDSS